MWIEHADEMAQLASAAEALTKQARAAINPTTRDRLLSLARAHRDMLSTSGPSATVEAPVGRDLVEESVDDFKTAA